MLDASRARPPASQSLHICTCLLAVSSNQRNTSWLGEACDAIRVTTINPYLIEQAERVVHFPAKRNNRSKTSNPMRFLLATSILASILISSSIAAEAGPMETAPPPAAASTVVHVQPRAEDFRPHSAANRAEQRRLSRFDARQKKLDKALDNNLSICRC
jgi:hypothetical protein